MKTASRNYKVMHSPERSRGRRYPKRCDIAIPTAVDLRNYKVIHSPDEVCYFETIRRSNHLMRKTFCPALIRSGSSRVIDVCRVVESLMMHLAREASMLAECKRTLVHPWYPLTPETQSTGRKDGVSSE